MGHGSIKIKEIIHAFTTPFIALISLTFAYKIIMYILSGNSKANENIQTYILGFITGTLISSIIMFYFGSSHGSQQKNDIISNRNNKNENLPR